MKRLSVSNQSLPLGPFWNSWKKYYTNYIVNSVSQILTYKLRLLLMMIMNWLLMNWTSFSKGNWAILKIGETKTNVSKFNEVKPVQILAKLIISKFLKRFLQHIRMETGNKINEDT